VYSVNTFYLRPVLDQIDVFTTYRVERRAWMLGVERVALLISEQRTRL